MEAQRWWWNRRFGRLARRDVIIHYSPERWSVEAREGGPEGRAKRVDAASAAEAMEIAARFRELGGQDWKELPAGSPHGR